MAKNQKRKKKQQSGKGRQTTRIKRSDLGPVVKNQFGDTYLAQLNSGTFDSFGSEAFYKKAYGAQLFQTDTLYVFVGTDSGLLPKFIQKQGVPENSRYLFIEPREIYEQVVDLLSSEPLEQTIIVCPSDDLAEILANPSFSYYIHADKNLFFESVAAKETKFFRYQELSTTVQQEWIDRIWRTKVAANQKAFIEMQLENLGENRVSSICLKDAFKGQTAVLLGGGPSLDDALSWIKENRDKLVVLAISRVCRRLREVDLVPDMVFSVDPFPINYENSIDLFHFWDQTLFINAHHVAPQLLGQWRGNCVYSGPRFPWPTPLNEETLPLANPTVTNTALVSAVAMGFSRVILAGVDLCFSPEGYTHAQGSNEYKRGPRLSGNLLRVETNGGSQVATTPDYANAIKEIGTQAGQALTFSCTVLNSALGAAVVPNVTYRALDDIILEEIAESAEAIVAGHLSADGPEGRVAHCRRMLEEIERGSEQLQQIRVLVLEALECIHSKAGSSVGAASTTCQDRMNHIEDQLCEGFSGFTSVLAKFGALEFQQISEFDWENPFQTKDRGQVGIQFYETCRDITSTLLKLVAEGSRRLSSRLEEEKDHPDFALLKTQWEDDAQTGRVLVWLSKRKGCVNEFHLGSLPALEASFMQTLEEIQSRYTHAVRRTYSVLDRENLLTLFKERESTQLGRYLAELERTEQRKENFYYSPLVMAMRPSEFLPKNPLWEQISDYSVSSMGHGESLFANVYLEPDGYRGSPKGICLQWFADGQRYRAVWGELPAFLWDNADVVVEIAPLPTVGVWVCLEVPADRLGLAGLAVDGFSVLFHGGSAYWDGAGVISESGVLSCWNGHTHANARNTMGQGLDWLGQAPYDNTSVTTSFLLKGVSVTSEDHLFVDIFLDPETPPDQIFLEYRWLNHENIRVCWGVTFPGDFAAIRMGDLPETGCWVRLTVPLIKVDSGSRELNLYFLGVRNGLCSWREIGIHSSQPQNIVWSSRLHKGDSTFRSYTFGQGFNISLPWPDTQLKPLVKGYLYELAGEKEAALAEYHKLVIENVRAINIDFLEDALKRIAALSLERHDFENTLLAYQCLAGITLSYVPQYAEMLRVMGRFAEAAEEYSCYLSQRPSDLISMLNLGKLYLNHMGSLEAARMAFECVLEKNPDNSQARALLKELESQC